jgi:hypothetical protein
MSTNTGFSNAINAGLDACRTPWVAVLNNDVELAPDWLGRLVEAAGDGYAFATGKVLDWSQRTIIDGTYDLVARSGCAWRAGSGSPDGECWRHRREIWCAPFTAVLFRTSTFAKLGHLDTDFGSYLEDVDFGLRCFVAGCKGIFVPEALAWHRGSATLGRWSAEAVRLISRNQLLLVAKHFPAGWSPARMWPVIAGQTLWGLLALRHGRLPAYLKGKIEGARLFGTKRAVSVGGESVLQHLAEAECEIRNLQSATASDLYWRLYFALT